MFFLSFKDQVIFYSRYPAMFESLIFSVNLEKLICCMKYSNISASSERMTQKLVAILGQTVEHPITTNCCVDFDSNSADIPEQQQKRRPRSNHTHLLPLYQLIPFFHFVLPFLEPLLCRDSTYCSIISQLLDYLQENRYERLPPSLTVTFPITMICEDGSESVSLSFNPLYTCLCL